MSGERPVSCNNTDNVLRRRGDIISHYRAEAWEWLIRQRRHAPHNADIWDLRFHKDKYLPALWLKVTQGKYRLSPARVHRRSLKGDAIVQWSAADALVMKWVALKIKNSLPVQDSCVHVAGHHGGRDSLSKITSALSEGTRFVWRTDIRGYYRHIRKPMLWAHVCRFVTDPILQSLIRQYIWYTVEDGGEFYTPPDGICRGSSLSPLLGASYLWYVDTAFARQENLFMSAIWMTFCFYLPGAGQFGVAFSNSGTTLTSPGLNAIRIKHSWAGWIKDLTGWASGLMQRGPPG